MLPPTRLCLATSQPRLRSRISPRNETLSPSGPQDRGIRQGHEFVRGIGSWIRGWGLGNCGIDVHVCRTQIQCAITSTPPHGRQSTAQLCSLSTLKAGSCCLHSFCVKLFTKHFGIPARHLTGQDMPIVAIAANFAQKIAVHFQ